MCFNSSGKGIPNALSQQNMAARIHYRSVPESAVAAQWYTNDVGTVLSSEAIFGRDTFQSINARQQCENQFNLDIPDLRVIFNRAVNGDYMPLQAAVLRLIHLSSAAS